MAAHCLELL